MATSQQSQRHAQRSGYQPTQQATQHRKNRDGGVDPSITTSESDTDRLSTYTSDMRKMTPAAKAMELLTTYHVTKLEKRRLTMIEHSLSSAKPWEKTDVVIADSLSQEDILEGLNKASRKDGRELWARTANYPAALQAQVDRATKDRERKEKDRRFVWELVLTDDELVPLQRTTEGSDHEKPDFRYNKSTRRYESKRKEEKMHSSAWSDSSSATGKSHDNKLERVTVTLYFKRSPGPGQNPVALYRQLRKRVNDSSPRHDTPAKTVPVAQNETPAREPIPVAVEHTPPVRHSTRPPPPVPYNTRPTPAPQPDPRPVGVASWGQQLPKASDTQQNPRPKQAAQSVPPHTGQSAQPTQGYQPASLYSDSKAQAAYFTQASQSAPPHTEQSAQPTQAYQPASLHSDLKARAAQFAQASRSAPPYKVSQTRPAQTTQYDAVYGEPRGRPTRSGQRGGPTQTAQYDAVYGEPRGRPTRSGQTAQYDAIYEEPRVEPTVGPTQSSQHARLRREPKSKAQPPQSSQPPPIYTESRSRPAEVPPSDQMHAKAKVQLPQAAQSHHYTKQRHWPQQSYEQPQQSYEQPQQSYEQSKQSRQPAVPQRTANVPSSAPVHSSEPTQYQSRGANLNGNSQSIHNLWDPTVGKRRSRRQSPRRRTHKSPESGESTASHYDDEEEIFSASDASMESASQYTFATASPKPGPARPSSDFTARARPVDGSTSAGSTAPTVRDGWGPSRGDARLPSPKLGPDGPSRPHARAPKADGRASLGTKRAAEMQSTYSDMDTRDPQSWSNVDSGDDHWWSGKAQESPEVESDHWDDLIYSDSDQVDESSRSSRHLGRQREAGDGNGGRESAGRGGGGRRRMNRGSAPRGNR